MESLEIIIIGVITVVGTAVGGLITAYLTLPSFRTDVRRHRTRWSIRVKGRMATMFLVPKNLLNYGFVLLLLSSSGLFVGFASLIPNSILHLDVISSLSLLLVSAISLNVAMGVTITASAIGIIQTFGSRKFR